MNLTARVRPKTEYRHYAIHPASRSLTGNSWLVRPWSATRREWSVNGK